MDNTVSKEAVLRALDQTVFWRKELSDLKLGKDGEASACCPLHEDRTPSFSVNLNLGKWICHGGCGGGDVFSFIQKRDGVDFPQAVAKLAADLGLLSANPTEQREIIRVFPYTDSAGHEAYKLRWSSGNRFSCALDPEGRQSGMGECQPLLYHLPQVAHFEEIMVVEGEHDVDRLNRLIVEGGITGLMVTCTPHGASKDIPAEYLTPLHDKRRVYVSGDNDDAGRKYQQTIIEWLRGQVGELLKLDVPDGSKDWAEWIDQGGTAEAFQAWLKEARCIRQMPWQASTEIVSGPHVDTKWLIDGILPAGTVVLISGREGSMKSWVALDWALTVADGRPWLGREGQKGLALYLDGEMSLDLFAQRIRGMGASPGLNVMHWQADEFPGSLNAPVLIQAAGCHDLIVIDTLRRFMGKLKEMSSDDMALLTQAAKQLTRKGATVVLLHHAVKDVEHKGYRGSTELGAGCDVVLHVEHWETESIHRVKISTQKTRYPQGAEFVLTTRKDLPAPIFEAKSAQDEHDAKLVKLGELVLGHSVRGGCAPNQGQIVGFAQHLGGRQAVLALLKAGEGTHWRSTLAGRQRVYHHPSICPPVSISNKEIDTEEGSIMMAQILSTETGGVGMDR
jgi:5S rRNA maturation endonuclease (ribonuclease M5)